MKQLQNDFTTPEQSEKLLELGIPADSANCYIERYRSGYTNTKILPEGDSFSKMESFCTKCKREIIPCWSVGRLIEIYSKCYIGTKCYYSSRSLYKTGFWIERFNRLTIIGFMDFSKLED